MKALILAAGYATRLYPLTEDYPKPLLKVGAKPIIDYIVDKLEKLAGIDEIIVVTNSRFISHFRAWQRGLKLKKPLSLVDDLTKSLKDKRGAIGDMDFAIAKKGIRDDLLIIGGDNIFDGDLENFLLFARNNKPNPVIGAYKIKDKKETKKYGVLGLDKKKRIIDFQEKPDKAKSRLIAMCLYYFPKEKLHLIRGYLSAARGKRDATGFYIDWLRKRVPVYGYEFKGHWFDIGDSKFYKAAKNIFK
ncbi:MAG: nucleotidyltransferase family protein [Candidatus Omnitrophota bacterium]|jgi:glucose-1-phosphate thymidylyltransferase